MTMLANYPSKKAIKESIGKPFKYTETSIFGPEYTPNGTLTAAGRPHMQPYVKREYFARVTLKDGIIIKVS